jgi:hypothetical protein
MPARMLTKDAGFGGPRHDPQHVAVGETPQGALQITRPSWS